MAASIEVTMNALDAEGAAAFWQRALGYRRLYERDPFIVLGPPAGDPRPRVVIQRVEVLDPTESRVHIDLRVEDPGGEVARLVELGGRERRAVDDTDRGGSRWSVMSDPSGIPFCVAPARTDDR